MLDLYQDKIKESTKKRAAEHGLQIIISKDENAIDPRSRSTTKFVPVDFGSDIKKAVKKHCIDVLKCKESDLVWAVMSKKSENGKVVHFVDQGEKTDLAVGFVYLTKDEIRSTYGGKYVGSSTKNKIISRFINETELYNDWRDGDVFEMSVVDKKDQQYSIRSGCYTFKGSLDPHANIILSEALRVIDAHYSNLSVCLVFNDTKHITHFTDALNDFQDQLLKVIKTKAAIGDNYYSGLHQTLNIVISMRSLPSLSELAEQLDFDIITAIKDKALEIAPTNKYGQMTKDEILSKLTNSDSYYYWSPLLFHAFLSVIADSSSHFSLLSTRHNVVV